MATFNLRQDSEPRFESPAKVFAKLKSKVQKESACTNRGILTGNDIPFKAGEKHGAGFLSPKKTASRAFTSEEIKGNQGFSSYRIEARALTLSPISSPQKTFDYTCSEISSRPLEETSPGNEDVRACSRRDTAVLESTAVSRPLALVNRDQIDKKTHQIIDSGGLNVPSRTPEKRQPVENHRRNAVNTKSCPFSKPMSPGNVFSPIKKRLRKRNWEQQELSKGFRTTRERNEGIQPPQKKALALVEENTHNNILQDFGQTRELSSNQPGILLEPMLPPRSGIEKCSGVIRETLPLMSPAKMFAYMKERESKKEQQEAHNSTKRDLFGGAHRVGKMENIESASERMTTVSTYRINSSDCPSVTECSEGVLIPAAPPQPILLEDPLVLNSPKISIPKTKDPVFKRNYWPKQKKFPLENVIYLKEWFLRKNHKGLFVDGIHKEDNIPWNSNIIVERVSNSVLRTVSGRVYILVGKMKMNAASDFPKWLLKKFASGFPQNWKTLYEKLLQESREAERNNEGRSKTKTNPEVSSVSHSVNGQKSTKTPEFRPPTSSSSTKVSRSGRLIKPPLDYWKGGRVILDAHMNVTIHECYDTLQSETSITVSPRASQKPVHVIVPGSKGWKQRKSAKIERAAVPVRKVNAVHKLKKAVVRPHEKPAILTEPAVEMLSSPEEWCGRRTRSSQRRLNAVAERDVCVNAVPQKQGNPSTQRSKRKTHDINKPLVSASGSKGTVATSLESPPANNETLERLSSDEGFSSKKKKEVEEVHVEKRGKDRNKSQSDHKPSSNQSPEFPEEGRKAQRARTREPRKHDEAKTKRKERKSTKGSPRAKPLKSKQSSKKAHANKYRTIIAQDEDEWTEAELVALQEAVSYYPKNITAYWANVARMVGTRSAEECHRQHTSLGTYHTPPKRTKKKVAAPKLPELPVITARAGTLRRKQQVRQLLQSQPRENVDDAFSSAYMQNKRFEIPSLCQSDDCDFQMSDLEPQTPMSSHFPDGKTPQCLHLTPGMIGSPSANCDDKYIYQLQKRMKKNQFNVCKNSPSKFTPTPSLKRRMRRCGNTENDTFVVWEMLAENDGALSESGEEDFYFSDN